MTEEQMQQLLALIAELKTLVEKQTGSVGEEFSKYQTQIEDINNKINEVNANFNSVGGLGGSQKVETIGQRFTKSAEFLEASKNRSNVSVTFADVLSKDANGNIGVPSTDVGEFVPRDTNLIEPTIGSMPVTTGAINYVRVTGFINRAEAVAQGQSAKVSDLTYEALSTTVDRIEHIVPIHQDTYNDAPALASIVEGELEDGVQEAVDASIVNALINDDLVQEYKGDIDGEVGDTKLDAIRRARTKAEVAEFISDVLYINPQDKGDIDLIKSSQGVYLLGNQGVKELWGLPVTLNNRVPVGKFIVGSKKAAKFAKNGQYELAVATQHNGDFAKSMYALKGARRGKTVVTRPEAWVVGSYGAPTV